MIRVLIVDDKQENLYLLRSLLQGHGFAVDEARHGSEALDRAHRAPPDLIISDLLMPVMDGYTLLRQWKADEQLQTIPFVVYTATYTEPKDERLALDLGADAFIIKPVEPEPFMARIREVLVKKAGGELRPTRAIQGDEVGLLKDYSEVLIRKLEQKVFQLEKVNRGFQEEIAWRQKAEAELLEAREDWENIFQATGHPTIIMDLEHGIIAANKKCIQVTGKPLEELLKTKCYEVFHTNAERPQGCPMEALLKEGSTETVEMEMEVLGGYYLVTCTPILDQAGKIGKVIHVITDITERKEVEEELRKSEARFRRIVETANEGVWSMDGDHRTTFVNQRMADMLGYSPEEMLGRTVDSFIFEEDLGDHEEEINLRRMGGGSIYERRFLRKDGGTLWTIVSATAISGPDGRFGGSFAMLTDITDRRRTEEALGASEEKYRRLFEESPAPIFVNLVDGTITDINQACEELFGYMRNELVGKNIIELYADPADRPRFRHAMEEAGFVTDYPIRFKKKDGTFLHCTTSASVQKSEDGTIIAYRGILRDLTMQLALQAQLVQAQKMEAVGTLADGVAHDFNNILQVALGYSDLILGDENLPQRYRRDLQKINESARLGAELVQRLLTFSRKMEIKPQPLNLNRRVTEIRKMLGRTIPKMIDIQLRLAGDLAAINADPTQMDQVLMNLAVNARDAMPDGGNLVIETANIIVDEEFSRTHLGSKPGHYVLLTVTDTGVGMDKETLEHIFEPFFTTKETGRGTGLGLAMVHGIVQQHQGHIWCYSELGEGTTFKMYFPALLLEEELQETSARPMPRGGSETILVVDDEEMIRDLCSRILTKAGYTVIAASSAKEALDLYTMHREKISLVILDLIMPEMGGKQCLQEVLEINPSIKVIIASGYAANGPTKDALSAGARGFVNKPYGIRQVLEVVRGVLDAE